MTLQKPRRVDYFLSQFLAGKTQVCVLQHIPSNGRYRTRTYRLHGIKNHDLTSCPQSGAPGGGTRRQVVTEPVSTEDELKRIGEAWSKLPQNIRAAILALVEPFSKAETKRE